MWGKWRHAEQGVLLAGFHLFVPFGVNENGFYVVSVRCDNFTPGSGFREIACSFPCPSPLYIPGNGCSIDFVACVAKFVINL